MSIVTVPSVSGRSKFLFSGVGYQLIRPARSVVVVTWRLFVRFTVRRDFGEKIVQRTYVAVLGSVRHERMRRALRGKTYTSQGQYLLYTFGSFWKDNLGILYEEGGSRGTIRECLERGSLGLSISQK